MNHTLVLVRNRNDTAARFHFGIRTKPLAPGHLMQKVTQWSVARHRCCFRKHDLTNVNRQVRMRVDVFDQLRHV